MNKNFLHIRTLIFLVSLTFFTTISQGQGFIESSTSAGINHLHVGPMLMGGGVAFLDYDRDGYEDVYLTGGVSADKLFRNNGDGTFMDVTSTAGIIGTDTVNTMGVVAGDIDNDGFKELFITSWDGYHNLLFQNNGDGTFQDISFAAGIDDTALSISATLGDVNKDGFIDIYVGNYIDLSILAPNGFDYTAYANYLYINNGNNTFTESGLTYGVADTGCALAVAFTDYDDEQNIDIYLANDFGKWVLPDALYKNDYPTASYTNVTLSANVNDSIFGMGIAIGDYDEDGDLDYYITNLGRNVLRQSQGNGTFIDYTDTAGVTNTYTDSTFMAVGWGTAFFDYDNDTYLDLIVSNGFIPADSFIYNTPSNPNKLFRNTGNGVFQDVSDATAFNDATICRGLAIGDFNYDGAVDVIVGVVDNNSTSSARTLVYSNDEQGNNWLKVSLEGVNTNRDAFGSHISLFAGGRTFIREVDGGSSHLSHNSSVIHFGLGSIPTVDSIIVQWLNGSTDTVIDVSVNQQVHMIEDSLFYTIHYQNQQICSGDSVFVGGAYQFAGGTYHDSLASGFGYDSIVHTSISYTALNIDTIQSEICNGDSLFAGGAYQFVAGIYTDTLSGITCDSIVVTDLLAWNNVTTNLTDSICNGELYLGTPYFSDTALSNTLMTVHGCDSIVQTSLTVLPTSTGTVDTALCEATVYLGNTYYINTTLIDTFANTLGCDSVLTTNIQVFAKDSLLSSLSVCEGDSANGIMITTDTTLVDLFSGTDGCDSVSITDVSVWAISNQNTNLSVNWGDTVNGNILYADTLLVDSFTSVNGCDSIERYTVTVGPPNQIAEISAGNLNSIHCFPNPFSSSVTIEIQINAPDQLRMTIHDVLGRQVALIYEGAILEGTYEFIWEGNTRLGHQVQSGIYVLSVESTNSSYTVPLARIK